MTAAKIAISLPAPLLAKVRGAVKRGRAGSVSAFVTQAVERRVQEDSLQSLLNDLIAEHGEPTKADEAWARRVLSRKRK
jgi:Arc/MetJ-type ribon-helix-helix transcriptional regulator